MGEGQAPYAVLYYPYARPDENWLKRSLLYWDRVTLIRPPGLADSMGAPGPVEAAVIRHLPDFFNTIRPDEIELMPLSAALSEIMSRGALEDRYGKAARSRLPHSNAPRSAALRRADPRLVWIYAGYYDGKFDAGVVTKLLELGLAEERNDRRDRPWLGLHPTFAAVYMGALADQIARRRALTPFTEDDDVHRAAGSGDLNEFERRLTGRSPVSPDQAALEPRIRTLEDRYLHLAIAANVDPIDIPSVPVEKLLEFRASHRSQLTAFRAHLATFEGRLRGLARATDEPSIARALTEIYEAETRPMVEDLRGGLRKLGVNTAIGALALKFSTDAAQGTGVGFAAGQLAPMVGLDSSSTTAVVAVAATVAPFLTTVGRASRSRSASPVAYLLAAQRHLSPDKVLARVATT